MTVLLDDRACGLVAHPVHWWEVLASHARSRSLDTALAHGHEPEESAGLAVRAAWLTTARVRRGVASCLEQILGEVLGDRPPHSRIVRADTVAVTAAQDDLERLVAAIRGPGPVAAQGMARAYLLLTDGAGPLYEGGHGCLTAAARDAEAALALTFEP